MLGNDYDPSLKKNIFAQLTCIVVVPWTSQEIRAIEKIWRPALALWVFAGNRETIFCFSSSAFNKFARSNAALACSTHPG